MRLYSVKGELTHKKPSVLMLLFHTHGSKTFLKLRLGIHSKRAHGGVIVCVLNIQVLVYLNQEIKIELLRDKVLL